MKTFPLLKTVKHVRERTEELRLGTEQKQSIVERMGTNHKRLIEELLEGRKTAVELQSLLHKPFGDRESAEELLMKIMTTFTESLSVLTASNGHEDHQSAASGEVYQVKPEPSHVEHSHCGDRSSEGSGESPKTQAFKDRRGSYKRRKTSQSWKVISTKIEDGQAWRKYGQKIILKASYPRAYFRCTRKYDQGCKATKQVQQIQDNPRTYQITYIGEHTCRTMIKASPMIIGPDLWPSQTVSSESGSPHRQNPNFFGSSSSSIPIVKQEDSKVGTPSDVTDNNVWLGLKDHLDFSEPTGICVSSNENVVSNMQWDDMVKSINFECDINFDEGFDAV
nr:WRKY DNA-binding transcription factor 70 [Malus domestica]